MVPENWKNNERMKERDLILEELDKKSAYGQFIFSELEKNSALNYLNTGLIGGLFGGSIEMGHISMDFALEKKRYESRIFEMETIMPLTKEELTDVAKKYDMKVFSTIDSQMINKVLYQGKDGLEKFVEYRDKKGKTTFNDRYYIMGSNDSFFNGNKSDRPRFLLYEDGEFYHLVDSWGDGKTNPFTKIKSILHTGRASLLRVIAMIMLLKLIPLSDVASWSLVFAYIFGLISCMAISDDAFHTRNESPFSNHVFKLPTKRKILWYLFPFMSMTGSIGKRKQQIEL